MNLLLDTHIWVWSVLTPERLKPKVAKALESVDNELWISPVSIWEVLVLSRKKRLQLQPDAEQWIRHWLRERPLKEAQLTREIAIQSERIDLPQADPADRWIAATARVSDLVLVTADEKLINCPGIRTLPN
jgi:PIN domain nuclease of toxin-antitoxin system